MLCFNLIKGKVMKTQEGLRIDGISVIEVSALPTNTVAISSDLFKLMQTTEAEKKREYDDKLSQFNKLTDLITLQG